LVTIVFLPVRLPRISCRDWLAWTVSYVLKSEAPPVCTGLSGDDPPTREVAVAHELDLLVRAAASF
jgi:hypothetical protein